MEDYNIGDVWWVRFPFSDSNDDKRRPAIVIDDEKIAILAMYVTSKNKDNPFSIKIEDWKNAGLTRESWARIDKIVSIIEWNMLNKIG
ncbi:type II toxin-antitoxin system PemK/MazF family toxin [Lachnospiraceae bacterium C1.1]|nr:type II toxin-antitoxin system PemK/MazF family toxin [Lachnospiraceae bacterium C1.1]